MKLVFLDIETTGVDPKADIVLEIGIVKVDFTTLQPTSSDSLVIGCTATEFYSRADDYVVGMHTKSGLLREALGSSTTKEEAGEWLSASLGKGSILAGYSVHFDRGFILEHFPFIRPLLHHRMVDVSTIRELAKVWTPGLALPLGKQPAHRAIADCMEALGELRHYRDLLFRGYNPGPTAEEIEAWNKGV